MTADYIELNATELVLQSPVTITSYLRHAIVSIDGELGEGYAARNPQLIGAFITAAASDFNACCLAQQIRAAIDDLVGSDGIPRALIDAADTICEKL